MMFLDLYMVEAMIHEERKEQNQSLREIYRFSSTKCLVNITSSQVSICLSFLNSLVGC